MCGIYRTVAEVIFIQALVFGRVVHTIHKDWSGPPDLRGP